MSTEYLPSFFNSLPDPLSGDIDTNNFLSERCASYDTANNFFIEDNGSFSAHSSQPSSPSDYESISSGADDNYPTDSQSIPALSPVAPPTTSMDDQSAALSHHAFIAHLAEVGHADPSAAAHHAVPGLAGLSTINSAILNSLVHAQDFKIAASKQSQTQHAKLEMRSPSVAPATPTAMPVAVVPLGGTAGTQSLVGVVPIALNGQTNHSNSGGSGGPVDTDTIRELLKEQTVKKQRLARKAELARMSRKRKKTRLVDLEQENARLREELERERKQRKVTQDCLAAAQQQARINQAVAAEQDLSMAFSETALAEESKVLHESIRRMLATSASGQTAADLPKAVGDVVGVVKKKAANAGQQMRTLQKHLTPSLHMRFLEWALSHQDAFYQDTCGLWNSLFVREVGLVPEQLQAITNLRQAIQAQRATSQEIQSAYNKLSTSVQTHVAQSTANIDKFVSVFTPEQLAKFFSWVDTYGSVCVQINV